MAYIQTNGIRTWKKKRKFPIMPIITILALVISAISTIFTIYFAIENQKLQNSLYNYQPFIYANNSVTSHLKTLFYDPNHSDGEAIFFGNVSVGLKVITPYDGMLTIKVKSFNFTYLNDTNNPTSNYLNVDNLNNVFVDDFSGKLHQYFVIRDVPNSIEDQIYAHVECFLKPHLVGYDDIRGIGFTLGDVVFEVSLFEVRTNQTITQSFNDRIWVDLVPMSS